MFSQLTEHIWYLSKDDETDRPALGYIYSGSNSLMVDSGNSPDHISLFYGNVRSNGMPDPSFIGITHWHWDHVFGLSGTPAKSIAHVITNEHLLNMQRWDWSDNSLNSRVAAGLEIPFCADMIKKEMPVRHSFKVRPADITFMEKCTIRLDEIYCHMIHVGGPHSEDSCVVYVPSESVLFLGDCYCDDIYCGGGSLCLDEFKHLLNRLEKFDAKLFVPSHEEPYTKEEFFTKMRHVEKIGEFIGEEVKVKNCGSLLRGGLGREPTEDELSYAEEFVIGNVNRLPQRSQ